ncbi:glutathione S-transferase family protein [Rugamonas rubra]|uniref:glutathione transferase n=1 Tax=Rugamonas rubra TaxID=758825 RepID=A0A1I4TGN9_9BURK|nr:glutathione S-transferase family protein [Rugamonas rubra]SFM75958.1 glutathione S-transferase [Rugamonas rubra]
MPTVRYTLLSHPLCPYVQRAAIVLAEKGLAFERVDIDLADKPRWFRDLSPLGKTPVLLVDGVALFESAVICEYLDETAAPRLHPDEPLARAHQRAWMEFGSAVLADIAGFYNAAEPAALDAKAQALRARFAQLEAACGDGPWFAGPRFGLVDAVFAPVFRYLDVFDRITDFGMLADAPRLRAWRTRLAERASVRGAAPADYAARLQSFLAARPSALARLLPATT